MCEEYPSKASHLYLQDMLKLKNIIDHQELKKFRFYKITRLSF